MLDILINASVLHDFLSKPIGSNSYYVQYNILQYVAICNSNTPDKKFNKPVTVRVMSAISMIESIQFGSDKMDKYLDKWTCRRTSSYQHVTYPADKL